MCNLQSTCHICQSKRLHKFLSLGPIPLANSFLPPDQLGVTEPYYPLDVCFCGNCGLVQLAQVIAPEILFKDYAYLTGTSEPMKAHFANLAASAIQRFSLTEGDLVLDIGSNDGTLLENFQKHGMRVVGVEPATNVAKLASSRGVETWDDFFNESLARRICSEQGVTPGQSWLQMFWHMWLTWRAFSAASIIYWRMTAFLSLKFPTWWIC